MKVITNTASARAFTSRIAACRLDAAHLMRDIIGNHDEPARTALDVSATAGREHLPGLVSSLVDQRAKATERRHKTYAKWQQQTGTAISANERWRQHHRSRTSSREEGIQL